MESYREKTARGIHGGGDPRTKTGSRALRTGYIRLNPKLCTGCWRCIDSCKRGVPGKVDLPFHRHMRIENAAACTGCMACVRACEAGAIRPLEPQGPGTGTADRRDMLRDRSGNKRPISGRGLASMVMLWSLICLIPSGILMHGCDDGFSPWRHGLMTVHNFSATLFVLAALYHLVVHRRSLKGYMAERIPAVPAHELVLSLFIVFGTVGFFLMHVFHAHRG